MAYRATEDGGTVVQETRLYDPDRNETRSMRSKEDAQDYRYFPDPDLPPLAIDSAWIERVRASLPELPELRKLRFSANSNEHLIELVKGGSGVDLSDVSDQLFEESNPALQASLQKPTYALQIAEATALVASRALADFFENAVVAGADAKAASRWLLGEVAASLNRAEIDIDESPVTPAALAGLLKRIADGTISGKQAKDVFDAMWAGDATGDGAADSIIAAKGMKQISDEGALAKLVDDVDRGASVDRRRVPRGQGEGVQRARRQGDGRVEGPGQPRAAQRVVQAQAVLTLTSLRQNELCARLGGSSRARGKPRPGTARQELFRRCGRPIFFSNSSCPAATRRSATRLTPARCTRPIRAPKRVAWTYLRADASIANARRCANSTRPHAATGPSTRRIRTRSASRAGLNRTIPNLDDDDNSATGA